MRDKCNDCKYFSEMIAESVGCGPTKAMCLCGLSKYHGKMVSESHYCPGYIHGVAIDNPIQDI
uniref:Uncharacterized protein n=1 Tax=viral metagenome TaxID=1070528 RepID=A0A6M3KST4_9ZZZZ